MGGYDGENLEVLYQISQWPLEIKTFMNEKSVKFLLWKDKQRAVKYNTMFIWAKQFEWSSPKLEVVQMTPWTEDLMKRYIEKMGKQRDNLIWLIIM